MSRVLNVIQTDSGYLLDLDKTVQREETVWFNDQRKVKKVQKTISLKKWQEKFPKV